MPNVEPLREGDPAAVGGYRIVGRLGAGGQGTVYLGQAPDGRPVAVKVLREGAGFDDRLAREVAAARRVEPVCVAQVLDASLGGRAYIVSEYVDGPSLQEAGRHAGADLQRLAVGTATALAAIHRAGLVHRDFKPANVLLGRDGPRVIDFGVARTADASASVASGIVGTPAYMAPEQLAGAQVGPAADVFAWASVIVFAATGTPPFGDDTLPAIINRILHGEPWLGDLPEPLRPIVHACLAKDPHHRPTMQDVLLRLIGGPQPPNLAGQSPALAGQRSRVPGRVARRFPLVPVLAGALAVSVSAGVVVWTASSNREPAAPVLAAHSTESTSPSTTPSKRRSPRPKKSRTPAAKPTPTQPIRPRPTPTPARSTSPSTKPTETRRQAPTPTPSRTRTTARPSPTATKAAGASFSIAYVRVQGSSKINTEGITCYTGSFNFGAGIGATKPGAAFSYQWLYNGKVIESGSSRLPAGSRDNYVFSKDTIDPPDGTHTVTYRITSPVSRSRSTTFTMCPTAP
ncbi:serine/threonine-protein kinase [Nonomuraea sp. SYSU D8015]|uniref:serine/threonine-protein kinase n=1 Tax=Nonomuraea sp. SYSU D8015 TaxID=2593644 RepID=UPI00166047EB|nr:serine/threonine-protein kinase [Nonomuraea sp. SYSU D8015]